MTNEKDVKIMPTLGRIVFYKLNATDVAEINKRRDDAGKNRAKMQEESMGYQAHFGNPVNVGDIVSGSIVAVFSEELINIKLDLDGTDCYWITSAVLGEADGQWHWIKYQKDQAKKHQTAIEGAELTPGQLLVGVQFNPSGDPRVNKVKNMYAEIIDDLLKFGSEIEDSKPLAYNFTEEAVMDAVKAQMIAVKAFTFKK